MIKSELVAKISERNPHLYQRDVEHIVNAVLEEVVSALSRGDRVELRGFGAFSVKNRPARIGRNPRTGEKVSVEEKFVPFFKTGKEMREKLNGKGYPDGMAGDAIPFNARAKEGAMAVANFLMSAEAQARKQDIAAWGDDTVLDLGKLSAGERRLFDDLPRGAATLSPEELGPTLLEPHPSWMTRIEAEWLKRYSR